MFLIAFYSLTIFTSTSTRESNFVGDYIKRKGEEKIWNTLGYSRENHVSCLEALERMDGKALSDNDKVMLLGLIDIYLSIIRKLLVYKDYFEREETDTREEMEGSTYEYERNKIKKDFIRLSKLKDEVAEDIGGLSIRIKLMKILISISKYLI